MADISDVSQALLTIALNAVYPSGTGQPSIAATPVRLYEGWPQPQQLDSDLLTGTCHVSVFTRQEEKNTTRYTQEFQDLTQNTATITLTKAGQTVTVGGAMPSQFIPHNLLILVNGFPYAYAAQSGDTLLSIAAALSSLIPGCTVSGAVLTLPNTARLQAARVGITGSSFQNIKQQRRHFQLSIWADTPQHRSQIAKAIDSALSVLRFIPLPDGTAGRLIYQSSPVTDSAQNKAIYRRDLIYSVDYSTTNTAPTYQINTVQLNTDVTDGATAYDINTTQYI